MKRDGFLLLSSMFVISILLILSGSLVHLAMSNLNRNQAHLNRVKAFYLAESAMAFAQAQLISNEAWFTDLPHYPSDDLEWLSAAAAGTVEVLGDGFFKAVKEKDKLIIYALGVAGRPQAKSFIKARYEAKPFRLISYSFL